MFFVVGYTQIYLFTIIKYGLGNSIYIRQKKVLFLYTITGPFIRIGFNESDINEISPTYKISNLYKYVSITPFEK